MGINDISNEDIDDFLGLFDDKFLNIFNSEFDKQYSEAYKKLKTSPDDLPVLEELILKLKTDYPLAYQAILEKRKLLK